MININITECVILAPQHPLVAFICFGFSLKIAFVSLTLMFLTTHKDSSHKFVCGRVIGMSMSMRKGGVCGQMLPNLEF